MICAFCKFFKQKIGEYAIGHCRRYPPQLTTYTDDGYVNPWSYFPEIASDEWCGEFQEKEKEDFPIEITDI